MSFLDNFERKIIVRGMRYFYSAAVLECSKINDHTYEGKVLGSCERIYDVKIDLSDPDASSCTCPYATEGHKCKHMAALYFNYHPDEAEQYNIKPPIEEYVIDDSDFDEKTMMAEDALYEHIENLLEEDFERTDEIFYELNGEFIEIAEKYDWDIEAALYDPEFSDKLNSMIGIDDTQTLAAVQTSKPEEEKKIIEKKSQSVNIDMFTDRDVSRSRKGILSDRYTYYYDSDGNNKGHSKRGLWNDRYTYYYDEKGNKTGYSKDGIFFDRHTDYYDVKGKKIGSSKRGIFFDRHVDYYDDKGRKVGDSEDGIFFTDHTRYRKKKK